MIDKAKIAGLNLTGDALRPGASRAWWLKEALAAEHENACPPLAKNINADVVIIGGGFTGLWTAYFLTEADPGLGVVVLERDICGGGPSGRNGGFASGWWDELDGLVALHGTEAAVRTCQAISASIDSIGEFCTVHGVDAWYRKAGYVFAATATRHAEVCEEMIRLAREVGAPEEMRPLTAEEVRARCESPAFRAGAYMKDGASVQPALLVRGLRRVLLGRGVVIHEGTMATRLEDSQDAAVAVTARGSVRARHAVLAVNAWATGWPQLRRRLVAWSSYIVLTAPAPERLQAIHWTGGELVSDLRTSVRYFRTTRDGRIAFGGGGGRAGTAIGVSFTKDMRAVVEAAEGFRRLFPSFSDVPIVDAWGGPIDVSPTHLPSIGSLKPNVHYALGYTGNGVAPSHLAGRVLADLITGADTDAMRLPIVRAPARLFPPQPLRALGAAVVRRAIIAKDTAEERGARSNPLADAVARLPRRFGYLLGP
ncbi:MAG TPA: FAD-binding oxidoreductase [Candidatus Dormibacteraeota bacterium]|nr:FAD-binding oxidoreductase [Candidatus Dormibacteraeota bacterium]